MPHKVGDKKSIENTKKSIEYYQNLILQIKGVKRGDSNSIKMGLEAIRELEFDAGFRKEQHLKTGDPNSMIKAHGFQQMQEAYQSVITLFETPDSMIKTYEAEIERLQPYLDDYDQKPSDK